MRLMESFASKIDKLNGSNYLIWRDIAKCMLIEGDCWEITTGMDLELEDSQRYKLNSRAVMILKSSMDESHRILFIEVESAQIIWSNLEARYKGSSVTRQLVVLRDFLTLEYQNDARTFLDKFTRLDNELSAAKIDSLEKWKVRVLLNLLPPKFNPMITSLSHTSACDSLESLKNAILEEETRLQTQAKLSQPLIKHEEANAVAKVPFCRYCKKRGHQIDDCWTKAKNDKRKTNSPIKPVSHYVTSNCAKQSESILDSGAAGGHFLKDKSLFTTLTGIEHKESLTLADNSNQAIIGRGKAVLQLNNGHFLQLDNAHYVPKLKRNLISTSELCTSGYQIWQTSRGAQLYKNAYVVGDCLGEVPEVGGLLQFNPPTQNYSASSVVKTPWHDRFGHPGIDKTSSISQAYGIDISHEVHCNTCAMAKLKARAYPRSEIKTSKPLQLIHADICGPLNKSHEGYTYYVIFTDDFSRYASIYLMKHRSEIVEIFTKYKRFIENQTNGKIKKLRTDRGLEWLSHQMQSILAESGIEHQTSVAYCHQQNGVAERSIQKINTMARSLLIQSSMPVRYWSEAARTAVYLANRMPHKSAQDVPYKRMFKTLPSIKHLKVFGSVAYTLIQGPSHKSKFEPVSKQVVHVGYSFASKAYRVLDPITGKVSDATNVKFHEGQYYFTNAKADSNANTCPVVSPTSVIPWSDDFAGPVPSANDDLPESSNSLDPFIGPDQVLNLQQKIGRAHV